MEVLIFDEQKAREDVIIKEQESRDQIELADVESYLHVIPEILSRNLRKTYLLPEEKWQLQQTNGFKQFKRGCFPSF